MSGGSRGVPVRRCYTILDKATGGLVAVCLNRGSVNAYLEAYDPERSKFRVGTSVVVQS